MQDDLKKGVREALSEFFSELRGKKPETALTEEQLIAKATASLETKFSDDLKAANDKIAKLEQDRDENEKRFSEGTAQQRAAAAITTLKDKRAWVPAFDKLGVPELFSHLAASGETVTFSDADNKEQKLAPLDLAVALFSAIGKIVPADRMVEPKAAETKAVAADGNGGVVDPDSAVFSDLVSARSAEKNIPFNQAYKELVAEGKRPNAGSSAAGAV